MLVCMFVEAYIFFEYKWQLCGSHNKCDEVREQSQHSFYDLYPQIQHQLVEVTKSSCYPSLNVFLLD